MGVVIGVSRRLAQWVINEGDGITDSVDRLTAKIAIRLNNYSIISFVLAIGMLTNKPLQTIMTIVSFVLLRIVTGGAHLKSLDWCVVVSTTLLAIIPHVNINYVTSIAATVLAAVLVSVFSQGRRILPAILILATIPIGWGFVSLSLLIQGITLINIRR